MMSQTPKFKIEVFEDRQDLNCAGHELGAFHGVTHLRLHLTADTSIRLSLITTVHDHVYNGPTKLYSYLTTMHYGLQQSKWFYTGYTQDSAVAQRTHQNTLNSLIDGIEAGDPLALTPVKYLVHCHSKSLADFLNNHRPTSARW